MRCLFRQLIVVDAVGCGGSSRGWNGLLVEAAAGEM